MLLSTLYTTPKQGKTGFVTKCRSKGNPRQKIRTLIGRCGLPTYITLFRWAEDTVGGQPISGSWTPDFASMAELIPVAYKGSEKIIPEK